MARTGMANVISELRARTEAGTADYTLGSATYWSDDQLQEVLDQFRIDAFFEPMQAVPRVNSSGDAEYYDYYFTPGYWEEASGGTAVWLVQVSTGVDAGTANYSVNYRSGNVQFSTDTSGSALYLTGRRFNVDRAAGRVWRQKAAHYAAQVDWSSDNHSFKASQYHKHCLLMADYYEASAGARMQRRVRSDVNI